MSDTLPVFVLRKIRERRERRLATSLVDVAFLGILMAFLISIEGDKTVLVIGSATQGATAPLSATSRPTESPIVPESCEYTNTCTKDEVEGILRTVAAQEGYEQSGQLVALAICESNLNPNAIGGEDASFFGIYQWNWRTSTSVSPACMFNVACSTRLTIKALKNKEQWRWPTCLSNL